MADIRAVDTGLENAEPRKLGHRPVLDGMRGIAIILVMLLHTGILVRGFVGVDLFFALSGFLITTLLYEEWQRTGAVSLRRFYQRRARRLLPALLVVVVASVLIDLCIYRLTGWSMPVKLLTTLLFVNNWVAGLGHAPELGGLSVTWSLGQEEQFYLLWPLLLAYMLRHCVSPRTIVAGLALAIVALLLASPHVAASVKNYSVYYSPVDRAAELLLGCLAAIVWHERLIRSPARLVAPLGERWVRAAQRSAPHVRLIFCCLLVIVFARLPFNSGLSRRFDYLIACVIGVLLIVNLMALPSSFLARAIGCAPLRYIGRISYALYLFHMPIYDLLRHWFPHGSKDLIALATFALGIGAASLSWRLLESRILLKQPAQQRRAGVRMPSVRRLDPGSA